MFDELPIVYFFALLLVVGLSTEAIMRYREAWSKPALAVYFTTAVWYLGDLIYNGIEEYTLAFSVDTLSDALVQVCEFMLCYRLFVGIFTMGFPKSEDRLLEFETGKLRQTLIILTGMQIVLSLIGLWRIEWDIMNLIMPILADEHRFLWGRGGVGQGFDFLVSFAGYVHIAVIGMIGVIAATSITRDTRLSVIAFAIYTVSLPPYVFQRARNSVLAVVLPCILAFVLNARIPIGVRILGATLAFLVINSWFYVIAEYRESGHDWTSVVNQDIRENNQKKHQGLDMLSELCHINVFIETGRYEPNWGGRYFAEAVSVVPRSLWKDKPYIGIDYAHARGFSDPRYESGVNTSVSTGLIGQGSVNFGLYGGPVTSAVLMALWTVVLSVLWMQRNDLGKFALFMLGMGLTFNMGRDITFLVLFPFVFGLLGLATYNYIFAKKRVASY